jgi:hypothetical protein
VSANAAAFAADIAPVLDDILAAGHSSLRAIAAHRTLSLLLALMDFFDFICDVRLSAHKCSMCACQYPE